MYLTKRETNRIERLSDIWIKDPKGFGFQTIEQGGFRHLVICPIMKTLDPQTDKKWIDKNIVVKLPVGKGQQDKMLHKALWSKKAKQAVSALVNQIAAMQRKETVDANMKEMRGASVVEAHRERKEKKSASSIVVNTDEIKIKFERIVEEAKAPEKENKGKTFIFKQLKVMHCNRIVTDLALKLGLVVWRETHPKIHLIVQGEAQAVHQMKIHLHNLVWGDKTPKPYVFDEDVIALYPMVTPRDAGVIIKQNGLSEEYEITGKRRVWIKDRQTGKVAPIFSVGHLESMDWMEGAWEDREQAERKLDVIDADIRKAVCGGSSLTVQAEEIPQYYELAYNL